MSRIRKNDRYSRQIMFSEFGQEGQERISQARVLIVGIGALGTVIANNLARAGVGYLRLVDHDFVELSNLQHQLLFNEKDIKKSLPKAVAAYEHLHDINSEIEIEPVVSDVTAMNIEELLDGIDLVLDATDNMKTRLLLNDACLKHNIPWIYGAALGSMGMSMNIIPGETACFCCYVKEAPLPGRLQTCSTAGILGMTTGIIGCIQSTEALKILSNSKNIRKTLLITDVWGNFTEYVSVDVNENCQACRKRQYEFLAGKL